MGSPDSLLPSGPVSLAGRPWVCVCVCVLLCLLRPPGQVLAVPSWELGTRGPAFRSRGPGRVSALSGGSNDRDSASHPAWLQQSLVDPVVPSLCLRFLVCTLGEDHDLTGCCEDRSNFNFQTLSFYLPITLSGRSSTSSLWFAEFNVYCGDFELL